MLAQPDKTRRRAIGPIQGASLVKIVNGFEDGAKSVNPNIEVQTAWTNSFTDTAFAKEAAQAMIESGVDIIKHCANESGTGAINAAKEAGIYAIGDSYDQSMAPKTILTSACITCRNWSKQPSRMLSTENSRVRFATWEWPRGSSPWRHIMIWSQSSRRQ